MSDDFNTEAEEASSLLQMARKLHEQHVSTARAEAEAIRTKALNEADSLLQQASAEANKLREDAKHELASLKNAISEAKEFEKVYRNSLREYLTKLLNDLDDDARLAGFIGVSSTEASPFVKPAYEPEEESESEETDPEKTFMDDAIAPELFDELSEPDSGDLVIETPITPEDFQQIAKVSDPKTVPAFNEPVIEVTRAEDTIEAMLDAEEADHQEEVASQPEPVTINDNIDALLESLSEIKGAEIEDDGGSSQGDAPDDSALREVYNHPVVEENNETEAVEAEEVSEDVSPSNEDAPHESAFEGNSSVEAFDEILSTSKEEPKDEAPKFSFFGKK